MLPIAIIASLAIPALAKEKQVVTISYVLAPSRPLPSDLQTVAVIDSGVDSDEERGDARELKWRTIAADMVEAMLQSNGPDAGQPLTVVQRRATKKILEEQDLQLAGIVQSDEATRVGQLLAVNGLITSRINIRVDVRRRTRSQIDWMGLLGGGGGGGGGRPVAAQPRRPHYRQGTGYGYKVRNSAYRRGAPPPPPGYRRGGGSDIPSRTVEEISRSLTVQCTFALVDARTGATVVQYASPIVQKTDKKSPDFLFGQYIDEADLDPVDHFIGELIERATRDFVSTLVPTRVEYSYEVIGRGDDGEEAVRALRAEDYETALRKFQAAYKDDPEEPDTVFGLGVACELAGDFDRALKYYRQVVAMKDVDDDVLPTYQDARTRLTAHAGRIVLPGGKEAMRPPPPPDQPPARPAKPNAGEREEEEEDD
jgi:hypothetical protein